ncbi:hypothetical protein LTR97_004793 [Elasticomyces elasticus]|uniref:Heterokaryon incompatibility domain-containing protein n=1 Tax=Elasticomyces elasticus TaxID=574655 RepID=A0AAN7W8Z2_9PEZI|nr:hypothetical protein LTR97_004793 [Elasticomyces elasticus]
MWQDLGQYSPFTHRTFREILTAGLIVTAILFAIRSRVAFAVRVILRLIISNQLCESCRQVDFNRLLAPVKDEETDDPERSLVDYEEDRAVWIPDLTYAVALQNTQCASCKLLVECGAYAALPTYLDTRLRSGISLQDHSNGVGGANSDYLVAAPSTVRFHLRPKFVWPTADKHLPNIRRPVNEGHINIRFCKLLDPTDLHPPGSDHNSNENFRRLRPHGFRRGGVVYRQDVVEVKPMRASFNGEHEVFLRQSYWQSRIAWDRRRTTIEPTAPDPTITSWTIDIVRPCYDTGATPMRAGLKSIIPTKINCDLVAEWLCACNSAHGHPEFDVGTGARLNAVRATYPLKVLDTSTYDIVVLPGNDKYVALSYVWGSDTAVKDGCTNTSRIDGRTAFAPSVLDALALALKLGYRWLWCDRHCINQQDAKEKDMLIPIMKDIYGLADLTIVAASGKDAYTGLAGVRDHTRTGEVPKRLSGWTVDSVYALSAPPNFGKLLEETTWRTRGWTFSEQIFSRRLLYIFPDEAILSCEGGIWRESGGNLFTADAGTEQDTHSTPTSIESLVHGKLHREIDIHDALLDTRDYVRAVEQYTSRALSVEEDRIEAFAGVIMSTGVTRSDPPMPTSVLKHGHPLVCFETALVWQHDRDRNAPSRTSTSSVFAPSWSWASAGTKVRFQNDVLVGKQNNWFTYNLLDNGDIVGTPTSNGWISGVFRLGPTSRLMPPTPPDPELQNTAPRLPRLRLLTVVFTAILEPTTADQFRMRSVSTSTLYAFMLGRWDDWSFTFARPRPRAVGLQDSNLSQVCQHPFGLGDPTPQTFAIVGGNRSAFIMLLAPCSAKGVFSRLGLLEVSSFSLRKLISIMQGGSTAWQHIWLV